MKSNYNLQVLAVMNILFMSLSDYRTICFNGLYTNLLRKFTENGDHVFILSPVERQNSYDGPAVITEGRSKIAKFKIGTMQKTSAVKKGIHMLLIDWEFKSALNRHFPDVSFDAVLYPTPPITLLRVVEYVKKRDGAKTYLLLKDIFPQNAVDVGLMKKTGLSGFLYRYFRNQERKLYAVSDTIGCMSQANAAYVRKHNPEVEPEKIVVCPNSAEPLDMSSTAEERIRLRSKYGIPLDKTVFVYGGNLGRPQGIPFLIECLRTVRREDAYFLIVGNGTEYGTLEKYITEECPQNVRLMQRMAKDDYDKMIGSCDVGLIFLDHRFTIPNFPSRLLSYMQAKLPVLACTDPNTDIGRVIVDGGFGWWCESNDAGAFSDMAASICGCSDLKAMGESGFQYLQRHYTPDKVFYIIRSRLQ